MISPPVIALNLLRTEPPQNGSLQDGTPSGWNPLTTEPFRTEPPQDGSFRMEPPQDGTPSQQNPSGQNPLRREPPQEGTPPSGWNPLRKQHPLRLEPLPPGGTPLGWKPSLGWNPPTGQNSHSGCNPLTMDLTPIKTVGKWAVRILLECCLVITVRNIDAAR